MTVASVSRAARLRDVRDLVGTLCRESGGRFWAALALLVLGTVTEGLSLVLLLPILRIAGGEAPGADVALAGGVGLPLPPALRGLAPLLLAFVAVVALQAAFNRWRTVYLNEVVLDVVNATRARLFEAVSATRWDALVRIRRAEFEQHLTVEAERLTFSAILVFSIAGAMASLVVVLAVALLVSPALLLVGGGAGLLALLVVWPFRGRAAEAGERLLAGRSRQGAVVSAFLSGLKGARAMGLEPAQRAAFAEALARTKAEMLAYSRLSTLGAGLLQVAFAAAAAAFVWVALRVVATPFATTVLFLVMLVRLAPRLSALQQQGQQLMVEISSFRAVRAFQRRLEADRDPAADAPPVRLPPPREEIRLDNVTLRFPGSDPDAPPALSAVTLAIPVGRTTALVGPSGSGKTTAADVVMGLLAPGEGRLLVDGRPLDPADAASWRLGVGYVAQEPVLIRDTLRANLLDAAPNATEAAMAEALRLAEATGIVDARGLDAPVGERGALLSGGERQRVAIAQALLRRPHLLVLDEATSGLDWQTQERLAANLLSLAGSLTVLVVAHRAEAIRGADLVHVIDGGRLVDSGAPDELARRSGYLGGMTAGARGEGPQAPRAPSSP